MRYCLGLLAFLLMLPAADAGDSTEIRTSAKVLDRSAPRYPSIELRRGRQGWVDLNFVVTPDGKVIDPVVEQSSGSSSFERAALDSVRHWRYEPATLDGEPVQQCKTKVRISFLIEGQQSGVSQHFYTRYRKAKRAIEDNKIDKARATLDRVLNTEGLTIGELSWLWTLKARIAELEGDKDAELKALRRASSGTGNWIPDDLMTVLLTTRASLELEKGEFAAAMYTYSLLDDIEAADTSSLDPYIDRIRSVVEGDELFFQAAKIGGNKNCETCVSRWQYRPLRRAIEIGDVQGELETLDIRCDWRRFVDEAREGVTWNIPESWGDCSIVVVGKPGSTFKVFEIPST